MEELSWNVTQKNCVSFNPEVVHGVGLSKKLQKWATRKKNVSIAVTGDDNVARFFARTLYNSLKEL
jgi:hypothetical protein